MTPFVNNIQLSLRSQRLATCGLTTTSLLSTELLSDQEVCNLPTMLKQMPTCLTAKGGFNVVFDTGTTKPISFNKDDFIGELRPPVQPLLMRGISQGLHVAGIGMLAWHFLDDAGDVQVIETEGYYIPELSLQLLSPQAYFRENQGGHMRVEGHTCKFIWKNNAIMTIAYDESSHIPIT